MIQFACPNCRADLKAPEGTEGRTTHCPTCAQSVTVPDAAPLLDALPAEPVPTPAALAPAAHLGRRPDSFRCPFCQSTRRPTASMEMSTAGVVTTIALIFLCLPLFWIGFLIREEKRRCSQCGRQLW
ncbi:MAG: LITAF-like zinc ribbon domain-containing protein [Planctomycetia bacterium]|nr:LITAF-like zinc ribbon domain-containing protein [Planctomycetia bacterium]